MIDAMDLLYQNDIDVFYIVSTDSDFTRLAMRIRESGKMVIGMGEKKSPESFVMACHDYIFFDGNHDDCGSASSVSSSPSAGSKEKGSTSQQMTPGISRKLMTVLREVVSEAAESDGWSELGCVASRLHLRKPGFKVKTYGFSKFIKLIEACGDSFLIDLDHPIRKKKKTIRKVCLKNR